MLNHQVFKMLTINALKEASIHKMHVVAMDHNQIIYTKSVKSKHNHVTILKSIKLILLCNSISLATTFIEQVKISVIY